MKSIITFILVLSSTFLGAQIVINEFVASNDSTSSISDEFGDFDDWVEIYNTSNTTVDLSGFYFTDDLMDLEKWRFPNGISLAADSYLIVWTDSDNGQGDLHTNFKLSKTGEQIILMDSFFVVLDSITFGEQETNVSMARIPNGSGDFTPRAPTFNANNDDGVFIQNIEVRNDFLLYPNPAIDHIQIDFSKTKEHFSTGNATLQITNSSGKLIHVEKLDLVSHLSIIDLDISTLSSGVHFLKIQTASELFLKKIIIK